MMVAVKTRVLSFGVASLARGSTPLALDIDDLEREFVRRRFGLLRQIVSPDHWPATHFLERWRPPLLVTTVASRKLQEKYGGEWLPHVRDRRGIREDRLLARALARRQLGLDESAFVVGFLGTVRRHKGIATLVEALKRVNGARLVIVGHAADTNNDVFTDVQGSPAIVLPGPQLSRLGAAMASFDIVAIPQSRTLAAEYQSPAKLLDAMAAGLPVVAGNTGDALEILGDTGLVVMPDSPAALADAISQLKNRQIRSDLARRTYARFLDCFDLPRWQTRIGARFEQSLAH
jgi:glycosyltransferase involved in cell wall biosynthesis